MNRVMFHQTDNRSSLFSGLRMSYKKEVQKHILEIEGKGQSTEAKPIRGDSSMGISIRISNAQETMKGISTTRHNLEDFHSCCYSISNTEDIAAADVAPCISEGIVDLFKDYYDYDYYINLSESLSVETDFVIVKFKHDFAFAINEKLPDNSFHMTPIDQVASLAMVFPGLGVYESGSAAGQTEGLVLGSLYQFHDIDESDEIQAGGRQRR